MQQILHVKAVNAYALGTQGFLVMRALILNILYAIRMRVPSFSLIQSEEARELLLQLQDTPISPCRLVAH